MIETNRFQVRPLIYDDWPEVVDISYHSFEYPANGTIEDLRATMLPSNTTAWIVWDKDDDLVLGYLICNMDDKDEYKILDFAVHHRYLRQGFGTQLLTHLAQKCGRDGRRVSAIVSERNLVALLFYKHYGFLAERGVIRRHFGSQDGIPMVLDMARVTELLTKREQIVATGYLRS